MAKQRTLNEIRQSKEYQIAKETVNTQPKNPFEHEEVDKAVEQIVKNFDATKVIYFGDKTEEGGNDFEIARKFRDKGGRIVEVNSWQDTYKCLQEMENSV